MKRTTTLFYIGLVSIFVPSIASHAEIYKAVTPDGQVVYTDNADNAYKASQDTTKITVLDKLTATTSITDSVTTSAGQNLPTSPTDMTVATTVSVPSDSRTRGKLQESQQGDYQLTIKTPNKDNLTYRRVIQPIEVEVVASPALKAGDRFVYAINGQHFATTSDSKISIPTDNYNPEKYVLTVKIENLKGAIVATAEQPFYILSNNVAMQNQRKALAKAKADYDKLPWYKKLKVTINL